LIRNHAPLAQPWDPKTGSRAAGVCGSQAAGVFGGGRLAAGWAEGAQLCWRAVRRHRLAMDRSRPLIRLLPEPHAG